MRNKLDQTTDARIAEAAKQCACGAHGAIMLHKRQGWKDCPDCDTTMWWNIEHTLAACYCGRIMSTDGANVDWHKMPACGPCAVALLEQGWTTEREGN